MPGANATRTPAFHLATHRREWLERLGPGHGFTPMRGVLTATSTSSSSSSYGAGRHLDLEAPRMRSTWPTTSVMPRSGPGSFDAPLGDASPPPRVPHARARARAAAPGADVHAAGASSLFASGVGRRAIRAHTASKPMFSRHSKSRRRSGSRRRRHSAARRRRARRRSSSSRRRSRGAARRTSSSRRRRARAPSS